MIYLQVGPLPWELELARWMALFLVMYATLRVIMALFYGQTQLLGLKWLTRDHAIICGANSGTARLCEGFHEGGRKAVVIDKDPSKDFLEKCREYGIVVLCGDPSDGRVLERAGIGKAACVIALSDDDGQNAAVALRAREAARGRKGFKPLLCFVQIADRWLCNALRAGYGLDKDGPGPFRLEFFNAYDRAADALLREYPPRSGGRVVIIGLGKLGESFLLRMATAWLVSREPVARMDITVIDPDAGQKVAALALRYPVLAAACEAGTIDTGLKALEPGRIFTGRPVSGIYVCAGDDTETLAIALALRRPAEAHGALLIACMEQRSGLSGLARDLKSLDAFDSAYRPEALLGGTRETLARAIHGEYMEEQERQGVTPSRNLSMATWEELPETLRESNLHTSDHILVKLAAVDCGIELLTDAEAVDFKFSPEEIEKMATLEHDRWIGERRMQGWIYAAGPKDVARKTSPYIVPWEQLAEEMKEYDRNVVRGLPGFLAGAGFQIYREKKEK